jgi:hypothetical protein
MPEETIGPAIEFLGVPPEGESNDAQVPESIDHIIPVEQQEVASAIGAVPEVRGLVVNEDDGFVFSDSDDEVLHVPEASGENLGDAPGGNGVEVDDDPSHTNGNIVANASCSDIPVYDNGNFEEVYNASIAQPLKMVQDQFKQLQWNDTPLQVQKSASDAEVCPI